MKINIKATNMELTQSISDYLAKKLAAFDKFDGGEMENAICRVEVGKTTMHHKTGDVFRAEINMTVSGKNFYAVSEKEDLYAAIDLVKDEAVRELVSSSKKEKTLLRKGWAKIKKILRRQQ